MSGTLWAVGDGVRVDRVRSSPSAFHKDPYAAIF